MALVYTSQCGGYEGVNEVRSRCRVNKHPCYMEEIQTGRRQCKAICYGKGMAVAARGSCTVFTYKERLSGLFISPESLREGE